MGASYRTIWAAVGIALAVTLGFFLSGCGGQSTATPQIEATGAPSATQDDLSTLIALQQAATEVPSATPPPSSTPIPTWTPPPTATATARATSTDRPTSTAEATATAGEAAPDAGIPIGANTGLDITVNTAASAASTATFAPPPTNTPRATFTPLAEEAASARSASPTPAMGSITSVEDHYLFARPFPRDSTNRVRDYPSRSYPYGSTSSGGLQTHHGIDIQNPLGTPVLAAGSGWVLYAGDDLTTLFGPQPDFYGNVVVIEHDMQTFDGRPIYTLYGHLSRVSVETGQRVEQGEQIGSVGAEGVALGSHLHLEVRLDDPYDYGSTYNPELWIRPWPTFGTLAGRIVGPEGQRVYETTITIEPQDRSAAARYAISYADNTVNPDPFMGEHYVRGDLPEGEYDVYVRVRNALFFRGTATIEGGKTTWLDIQLEY